jgi:MFS family permease
VLVPKGDDEGGEANSISVKKSDEVALRGLLLPVYIPSLLLSFGQSVVVPTLPLYAKSFGVSFSLISLAVASASIATMLADVPSGMLLERMGRRPMMLVGCAMIALSSLGLVFAHIFPELVLYRLIGGVGQAFWSISRLAYLTDTIPLAQRGRAISSFGGITRIGSFSGPAIGGVIGQQFGLASPFVVIAATATAAAVISYLHVAESGSRQIAGEMTRHTMRWRVVGNVIRTHFREFGTAGSAQVFAQMIRAGRQIIVPLYGSAVLNLPVGQVGAIVSISAAVDMVLFIPAGLLMDRLGRKFASVPSFVILSLGMALIPLSWNFASLAVATLIMGFGNGLGSGAMMTLGADLAPRRATGEFLGVWRLIGDFGSTGGPLAVGGMSDIVGLGTSALMLSGIGVIAALLLALFVQETLQRQMETG